MSIPEREKGYLRARITSTDFEQFEGELSFNDEGAPYSGAIPMVPGRYHLQLEHYEFVGGEDPIIEPIGPVREVVIRAGETLEVMLGE